MRSEQSRSYYYLYNLAIGQSNKNTCPITITSARTYILTTESAYNLTHPLEGRWRGLLSCFKILFYIQLKPNLTDQPI